MASRSIDLDAPKVSAETRVRLSASFLDSTVSGGVEVSGKQFTSCEYTAFLNRGETFRITLADPYFTMINNSIGSGGYYRDSRSKGPLNIRARIEWAGGQSNIHTPYVNHALVAIAPKGGSGNSQDVELLAIDYASWFLNGGDAGGNCYKGSIEQVIKQVVEKYGHGILKATVATKTRDSPENRWWQCRMTPKAFINSLLEWAPAVSDKKTQWFVYPDDEGGASSVEHKVTFIEQGAVESKKRAIYSFKGCDPAQSGQGDIINWELLGDNSLALIGHKFVTSGISAVSGAYFDRRTPDQGKKAKVGDIETDQKLKPKVSPKTAYTRPSPNDDPLTGSVGWTAIPSLPEPSAGELGLKFDEYMIGPALNIYQTVSQKLLMARFRVTGHYIWAGSEGLGADTFEIKMHTAKGEPHFLKGNWIILGYKHTVTRREWVTDLYGYRLDHDAEAKAVG